MARPHRISGAAGKSDSRTGNDGAGARWRIASFHQDERGWSSRDTHRPGREQSQPGWEHPGLRQVARDGAPPRHRDGAYGNELYAWTTAGSRTCGTNGSRQWRSLHNRLRKRTRSIHSPRRPPDRLCHAVFGRNDGPRKETYEQDGIEVDSSGHLADVRNIYEENSERAYAIARQVDRPEAEAIFLSGVGMPTLDALQVLEQDTGKPVISAASAMMWHALRSAGVQHTFNGYGRLLGE